MLIILSSRNYHHNSNQSLLTSNKKIMKVSGGVMPSSYLGTFLVLLFAASAAIASPANLVVEGSADSTSSSLLVSPVMKRHDGGTAVSKTRTLTCKRTAGVFGAKGGVGFLQLTASNLYYYP